MMNAVNQGTMSKITSKKPVFECVICKKQNSYKDRFEYMDKLFCSVNCIKEEKEKNNIDNVNGSEKTIRIDCGGIASF